MGLDLDSEPVQAILIFVGIVGVFILLFFALQQIGKEPGQGTCPPMLDKVACGVCPSSSSSSHAGMCRTCPLGRECVFEDICGDIDCVPTSASGSSGSGSGSGSSGSGTYYVSCSGCKYGQTSYSYRGGYSACNSWYQVCVQAECSKILDNCR